MIAFWDKQLGLRGMQVGGGQLVNLIQGACGTLPLDVLAILKAFAFSQASPGDSLFPSTQSPYMGRFKLQQLHCYFQGGEGMILAVRSWYIACSFKRSSA